MLDRTVEHSRYQVGVNFHAGVYAVDRRRALVEQAGGCSSDDGDLAAERIRRGAILNDIGQRHITEASLPSAKRHKRARSLVDRNVQLADREPFHHRIPFVRQLVRGVSRLDFGEAKQRADDRQRQRFVVLPLMFDEHRDPAHDPVEVNHWIEVTPACGALLELRQISAVTYPRGEVDVAACESVFREYRLGKGAKFLGALVAIEVVTQDDRPTFYGLCEQAVVVQFRTQLFVRFDECGDLAQVPGRKLVEPLDAGTVVWLREHHIERHHRDLVPIEQFCHEPRHDVPWPGPAPDLLKAFFIDVENDDPIVNPARHGQFQPGVVNDVIQLGDDSDFVELRGVTNEKNDDGQTEDDPDDVLFHSVSAGERAPGRAQVLMKNSIFTPASSIRS